MGVEAGRRARALSFVMAGGLFGGVLGPQLVNFTMAAWPRRMFALSLSGAGRRRACWRSGCWPASDLPPVAAALAGGRPTAVIARQPRFIVAVICGVISYLLMNFVMTSAPLAMNLCGLDLHYSNLALQWHVLAMYAPSFFTGRIITRFGATPVVVAGLLLTACAAATGLAGMDVAHFSAALILLGLGWNFAFIGASTMVLETHRPEERTRVQSLNDFLVFGTLAAGSFASGGVLTAFGWSAVCLAVLPPVLLGLVALGALQLVRRRAAVS